MYGTSSTVVYIKNTTAVEQRYVAHLNYEGGNYRMGLKTIAPGKTVTIDIRALRDGQVLDDEERTIPPEVSHGQVRWTLIQSKGTDPLALIGRAEQVDEVKAIGSTYACQNCCGDFFTAIEISPSSAQMQVGQSVTMRAFEIRNDCYGYSYPVEQTASWNSSNPSVATVSGGQVTSTGAGQTTITATWNSYSSIPTQCGGSGVLPGPIGGCCSTATFFRSASATANVVGVSPSVSISGPNAVPLGTDVNTIQLTASGNPSGGTYLWSTTSSRVTLTNTSSATLTIRSVSQSLSRNDVTINLAYSLNVQTAHTLTTITVQRPTSLSIAGTDSTTALAACATNQCGVTRTFDYRVNDQFGDPILVAGMQFWDSLVRTSTNTCNLQSTTTTCSPPNTGPCGPSTSTNGTFDELLFLCTPRCHLVSGSCADSGCTSISNQTWSVNGITLGADVKQIRYGRRQILVNGQ